MRTSQASPSPGWSVVPLHAASVATSAGLLAAAMDVDPAYRFLIQEDERRTEGLRFFFQANLRVHLAHRCVHVLRGSSGETWGTVTVRPPEGLRISTLTMLRYGLGVFALRQGHAAVKRLLWLKQSYEALEHEATGGRPHWFVHMMAVDPRLQGRGMGTRLLKDVLARSTRAHPGIPFVLTTHLEQNVTFYRRAGFRVRDQRELHPPRGTPYEVWTMVRD